MTGSAALRRMPDMSFSAAALDIAPVNFRPLLNRREIEQLFAMDRSRQEYDGVWQAYFVEQIVEFVVHGRRPTGIITQEDADWLVEQFGDTPSPTIPALVRCLVAEAENVPHVLLGYALSCGAMRI